MTSVTAFAPRPFPAVVPERLLPTVLHGARGAPWLARTLDWQRPAGEYVSVTWPAYVSTINARAVAAIQSGTTPTTMLDPAA
jgi:hypothetical protein